MRACAVLLAVAACGRLNFDELGDGGGSANDDAAIPPGTFTQVIQIAAGNAATPASYSISLTFDHAALVMAGRSLPDGSDVGVVTEGADVDRVLDPGSTWNASDTRIWFRCSPPVAAGATNTEHVLVYGRGARTPQEDRSAVFVFWDDFEAGLGRWQIRGGTWNTGATAVHGGASALEMAGPLAGANRWIVASDVTETDVAFEGYWRITSDSGSDLGQGIRAGGVTSPSHYLVNLEQTSGLVLAKDSASGFAALSSHVASPVANAWTRVAIAIAGQSARLFVDGAQVLPAAGGLDVGTELATGSVSLYLFTLGNNQRWSVDDVFVRRYVDPEPVASLGMVMP